MKSRKKGTAEEIIYQKAWKSRKKRPLKKTSIRIPATDP